MIAFLEGNSKIGLRRAVVHVLYYHNQPPVLRLELHVKVAEEIDLCYFRNFGRSVTLNIAIDRVVVSLVRMCGRGLPTHQIHWKSEKFLWTYVRTNLRTDIPQFQFTRSSVGDHLKILYKCISYFVMFLPTSMDRCRAPNATENPPVVFRNRPRCFFDISRHHATVFSPKRKPVLGILQYAQVKL